MSRAKTFLRYGSFLASVGSARVAGVLISTLTFPYLVRRLGVETYGLWSYVVAVCAILETVANPGLVTYTGQQVAARRQGAFEVVSDVLFLRLLGLIVAVSVLLFIASREVRPDVRVLFIFYGGILFLNVFSTNYLLNALEKFHISSLLGVVQQALYAAGIFLFVRSPKDVFYVPGSILVSVLVTNFVGWTVLRRQGLRLRCAVRPKVWWAILVPSAHYAVSSLLSSTYHRTGHIVVRWLLGEHALGIYATAARLVDILKQFVSTILSVVSPRLASATAGASFMRIARFTSIIIAVTSIPVTIGLMSTAHLIVPWVLGPQYLEDIPLLKWMAPYVLAASASSFLAGTVLYAMGKYRAYLISTAGGAVVGVVLYLALTRTLGLTGAGIAYVLGELAVAVVAIIFVPGELRVVWRSPMVWTAVLSALLMVVVVKAVGHYTSRPVPVVLAGALVYLLVCGWSLKGWLARELS